MKKFWITIGIIVALLLAINFLLEPVALKYVNKTLSEIEGYRGEVKDIDIALWRGAYRIDSLKLDKMNGDFPEPFFQVDAIDISIEWAALFKGSIVGEIIVERPRLTFAVEPSTGDVQAGEENDWTQTIKDLVPLQINRFEIVDGTIAYKDATSDPKVDVAFTEFNALATNLGNVNDDNELLPSSISVSSNTSGNGRFKADMAINVLKKVPDFDLSLELRDLELSYLKDFTNVYANFTFKEGSMYVSSEVAMKNGKYDGYVKPVLDSISVIDLKNDSTGFWQKAWEVVIGGALEAFENQPRNQFATKVPFSGTTEGNTVGLWSTIGSVMRNAFIEAFQKNVDQTVNIQSVDKKENDEGFFETLFDGDKKKDKKKE